MLCSHWSVSQSYLELCCGHIQQTVHFHMLTQLFAVFLFQWQPLLLVCIKNSCCLTWVTFASFKGNCGLSAFGLMRVSVEYFVVDVCACVQHSTVERTVLWTRMRWVIQYNGNSDMWEHLVIIAWENRKNGHYLIKGVTNFSSVPCFVLSPGFYWPISVHWQGSCWGLLNLDVMQEYSVAYLLNLFFIVPNLFCSTSFYPWGLKHMHKHVIHV